MCGRFHASHLTWRDIHDQLVAFTRVTTSLMNLQPKDDVGPTTGQVTARLEDGAWVLEKRRWGLVPFWSAGEPLKDTAKGARVGFKLTRFNGRIEQRVAQALATLVRYGRIEALENGTSAALRAA